MYRFVLIIILSFVSIVSYSQNNVDDIIGYYFCIDPFSGEKSQIEIYKSNDEGTYNGKVVWIENVEKRKDEGYLFMHGLKFNEVKNEWQNGIIKYPGKIGTFDTYMFFVEKNKLEVRGYWKIVLLGKTMYWYKEKEKRKH